MRHKAIGRQLCEPHEASQQRRAALANCADMLAHSASTAAACTQKPPTDPEQQPCGRTAALHFDMPKGRSAAGQRFGCTSKPVAMSAHLNTRGSFCM